MFKKPTLSLAFLLVVMLITLGAFSFANFNASGNTVYADDPDELFFTLLHTNDEHSALLPHPVLDYNSAVNDTSVGGFARLATVVENVKSNKGLANEPVIMTSGGDFISGEGLNLFSWLIVTNHAAELKLMQQIGYDAVTLGNHEFDYTDQLLAHYLANAGYPGHSGTAVVATNTHPPGAHPLSAMLQSTHTQELDNGLKVGYIGLQGPGSINAVYKAGNVTFSNFITAAQNAVTSLQEDDVDIIIAIVHGGQGDQRRLAEEVPGLNIVVGGHSHSASGPEFVNGTIIFQTNAFLTHMGMLELAYHPGTGELRLRNEETGNPYQVTIDDSVPLHPGIAAEIEQYTQALNNMVSALTGGQYTDILEIVAYSNFELDNYFSLGSFVTDAVRLMVAEETGERVDFVFHSRGLIPNRLRMGSMPHSLGAISFYDLASLPQPGPGMDMTPGNSLISTYLTGEEVRRILEISTFLPSMMGNDFRFETSGLRYYFDPGRNNPVPTLRSVYFAEIYTGAGPQTGNSSSYEALNPDQLYHVVADYFVLSVAPMVAQMFPDLAIVPKDETGTPLPSIFHSILYDSQGNELKMWKSIVDFAAAQPANGPAGAPLISSYYETPPARAIQLTNYGEFNVELDPPEEQYVELIDGIYQGQPFDILVNSARGYSNSALVLLEGAFDVAVRLNGELVGNFPDTAFVEGSATLTLALDLEPGTYTLQVEVNDKGAEPGIAAARNVVVVLVDLNAPPDGDDSGDDDGTGGDPTDGIVTPPTSAGRLIYFGLAGALLIAVGTVFFKRGYFQTK